MHERGARAICSSLDLGLLPAVTMLALAMLLTAVLWADDGRGVTLYEQPDYRGREQTFFLDAARLRLDSLRDFSARSVRVAPGCTVTLYRDADYRGSHTVLRGDHPDLNKTRMGSGGASSLDVICHEGTGEADGERRRSEEARRERKTGVEFAGERFWRGDRYQLALVGSMTVSVVLFKLNACAVAAYTARPDSEFLEQPSRRSRQRLVGDRHAKILVMQMVRDVDRQDVQDLFRQVIDENLPSSRANEADRDRLIQAIPATSSGDELEFVWVPDGALLEFIVADELEARFENADLAAAIWSILN